MTLATGTVLIDRYRIVRLLGQGGFGAVYRVWDLHLNAPFALKENLDTSPEAVRQFAREAQILANLHHSNLPRVTDHFSLPDQGQYLVMEYVEGEDLEEMRSKSACQPAGSLPEEQVLPWMSQILDALEYLHNQNPPIIHRDIKPANIRITPQGRATLVDFGIAKIFNPVLKTTVGARAITPGFSPLEQYGQAATDARSDIYALGATLYVLLTGRTPPESTARAWNDPLLPPDRLNPRLSPTISIAISKAMQADPVDRWQNIAELRLALHQATPVPAAAGGKYIPTVKEISPASQDVILVSPAKPVLMTTPIEAAVPAQRGSRDKVAPTKGIASKRKIPWLLFLAGGAVLFLCIAFLIAGNIFGDIIAGFDYPTDTPEPALGANPTYSSGSVSSPVPAVPGEYIKIGLLMPFSGPVPTFGKSMLEGATMAVQEWNDKGGVLGRQILLLPEDSQCTADPAVKAANKLINQDGVKYIVGEVCSNASIPVSEIANQKGVVMISPSSTNLSVTVDKNYKTKKYIFRACFIDSYQAMAMALFAQERGYKTAFIIYNPNNSYVDSLAVTFRGSFGENGGRIVGEETYDSNATDFTAILEKVASSRAEILYIPDYYNIVNQVAVQARQRGLSVVLMGGDGWDSADLDTTATEGGFYTNHYDPGDTRPIVQEWVKRYGANMVDEQGNPKIPDAIATLTYDATNMLLASIQQAGVDDPSQVADTLAGLHWEGVTGAISFGMDHDPNKPVIIMTIRNGQKAYVDSLDPWQWILNR
jgi:branched-chain amino acid transport system substrate-binding protein